MGAAAATAALNVVAGVELLCQALYYGSAGGRGTEQDGLGGGVGSGRGFGKGLGSVGVGRVGAVEVGMGWRMDEVGGTGLGWGETRLGLLGWEIVGNVNQSLGTGNIMCFN